MHKPVSTLRISLLRLLYLLTFLSLGPSIWGELASPSGDWLGLDGVAYSLWGALAALMGLGYFYPLKMIPLLLFQFLYKSIWLLAVGLPLWMAADFVPTDHELFMACGIGVILDLLIIPWRYVISDYFVRKSKPMML